MATKGSLGTELSRALPGLRTSDSPADRVSYARDLWPRHHLAVRRGEVHSKYEPGAIVWPESTVDVARIVRWAHDTETPIVPFGAGSGVCAAILPDPRAVVVDLKKLARVHSIEPCDGGAILDVDAGYMGITLEEYLEPRGYTLGHFPSSILCSTVGGWIAARSAGQCSGKYGKIEDMVLSLECVTGTGDVVTLHTRNHGPSLVPLVVGSEGTLGIVTRARLRLHAAPRTRVFSAWSFGTTEQGWEAMRELFQAGLRPAVSRLYDPFDAMLAKRPPKAKKEGPHEAKAPGFGASVLRSLLKKPEHFNSLVETLEGNVLGDAMLVLVFEGSDDGTPEREARAASEILERRKAKPEGEGPARKWFLHRYSVSYRQAPVFASGLFSDTIEVAAPWSRLSALYDGVRKALGDHVFVMAHLSHAYPDGCCIYFSFAGSGRRGDGEWERSSEEVYDRAWKAALAAAVNAGGTLAHHHGVGRSKAPRLREELGQGGIASFAALKRAFDPRGILNPGALVPGREVFG